MKALWRLAVISLLSFLVVSCDLTYNARIYNESGDKVTIAYTTDGKTYKAMEADPDTDGGWSEIPGVSQSDILDVKVVKGPDNLDVLDNAYAVYEKDMGIFKIKKAGMVEYTVKNLLPSEQYDDSTSIFLAEKNNRMARYSDESKKVELTSGYIGTVSVYGTPSFILVDVDGKQISEFGGFTVGIRLEEGIVYIE